jgi:hypothetical protein
LRDVKKIKDEGKKDERDKQERGIVSEKNPLG